MLQEDSILLVFLSLFRAYISLPLFSSCEPVEHLKTMAEPLPAALKIPEVYRFVNRANQLRSIKPAIAYWCMSRLRYNT